MVQGIEQGHSGGPRHRGPDVGSNLVLIHQVDVRGGNAKHPEDVLDQEDGLPVALGSVDGRDVLDQEEWAATAPGHESTGRHGNLPPS